MEARGGSFMHRRLVSLKNNDGSGEDVGEYVYLCGEAC